MTKKIKLKISARLLKKKFRKQPSGGVKHCRFCGNVEQLEQLDYKNGTFLRSFVTERGKILPSRISGNCAKHQRVMSKSVKKSRMMALVPYTAARY